MTIPFNKYQREGEEEIFSGGTGLTVSAIVSDSSGHFDTYTVKIKTKLDPATCFFGGGIHI
jgi:hypothetical protein